MARIAVAMSGGVDSSVTAALLAQQGHELIGVTMRLGAAGSETGGWEATRACCGLSEVNDARRVADKLGIRHYVLDHTEAFQRYVVDNFLDEYACGRTPNPCVRCNQFIKFATFLEQARALGCTHVATGHYARLDQAPDGRWRLRRGADANKDQSYVLHCLDQDQLAAALFPLGGLTKSEVRRLAEQFGLPTAHKQESQDICFVAGNHGDFVAARRAAAAVPGPLVTPDGRRLGTHRGLAFYTIGQRKGLGLDGAERWFVAEIRASDNTVIVAQEGQAERDIFRVKPVFWGSTAPQNGGSLDGMVQVRYRMKAVPGVAQPDSDSVLVRLAEPIRGIAPGQSAVVYDADGYVLLGGPIAEVLPRERE